MRFTLYLSAVVLVAVCATWAYRVNYGTQEALNRVADLRAAIAAEREAVDVLKAEWAYLNRPDRLRSLVTAHFERLQLIDLQPGHYGEAVMVAFPPEPELELAPEAATTGDPR